MAPPIPGLHVSGLHHFCCPVISPLRGKARRGGRGGALRRREEGRKERRMEGRTERKKGEIKEKVEDIKTQRKKKIKRK